MFFRKPNLNFERGARSTLSFLLSMTAHIALLLILACYGLVAGRVSHGLLLVSAEGDSLDTAFDLAPMSNPEASEGDQDSIDSFESIAQQSQFEFKADDLLQTGQSPTAAATLTSTGGIKSIGEGLDTRGLGRGASFFGTYAQGGRFVYVIDSSQSMKGDRWKVARQKLIESLKSLGGEQEFFVICFDQETTLLFNSTPKNMEFKRVNEVIIERVSRWLRSRTLGPATMPSEALQYAISMNPDAIFVLSDGELQDNTLQMMRMTNITAGSKKQIPVHAIHLMSAQGMDTLKLLAEENGGTFRHVDK